MTIQLFSPRYRDDLLFMVLSAKDALGLVPTLREDLLDIPQAYLNKGDSFWIATDDNDRVIGCLGYHVISPDEAFLHRFFIKPSMKRQGIGTALLRHVEQELQQRGIKTVRVHLGAPKEIWHESYAFYAKHGFTEYASRYWQKSINE